jgi:MraZ protein
VAWWWCWATVPRSSSKEKWVLDAYVFYGEYEHGLDDKGRVIIPQKFREALDPGYYLTRGLEGCLWLFPSAGWEDISAKLSETKLTHLQARLFERLLYSGTYGNVDRQGRLLVPSGLREYAQLSTGGQVVLIGVRNRFELWNVDRWRHASSPTAVADSGMAEKWAEIGV